MDSIKQEMKQKIIRLELERELAELVNKATAEFKNKEQNQQHIKPNQCRKESHQEVSQNAKRRNKGMKIITEEIKDMGRRPQKSNTEIWILLKDSQDKRTISIKDLMGESFLGKSDKRPEIINWKEFIMSQGKNLDKF